MPTYTAHLNVRWSCGHRGEIETSDPNPLNWVRDAARAEALELCPDCRRAKAM